METKTKPTQKSEDNIHKDHRKRMRQKLSKSPEMLSDHEVVEMILYNVIRRGNTNEQAHKLLDMGGDLKGILELKPTQIKTIKGLGNKAVLLVKLLNEFCMRIESEKLSTGNSRKITRKNISGRLHKMFLGFNDERLLMLTVDKECCLLGTHVLARGTTDITAISLKNMVRKVIEDDASYVFFAHNHPNEILAPTTQDLETTRTLCEALALVDIPVIEHYIVNSVSEIGIIDRNNVYKLNKDKMENTDEQNKDE